MHGPHHTLVAFGMSVPLLLFAGVVDSDEARCANTVNKWTAKVAKAQVRSIARCVQDGGAGKLVGTIEECITSDSSGRVGKSRDKLTERVGKDCAGMLPSVPPIDVSDPNTLSQTLIDTELALIHAIFDTDLNSILRA